MPLPSLSAKPVQLVVSGYGSGETITVTIKTTQPIAATAVWAPFDLNGAGQFDIKMGGSGAISLAEVNVTSSDLTLTVPRSASRDNQSNIMLALYMWGGFQTPGIPIFEVTITAMASQDATVAFGFLPDEPQLVDRKGRNFNWPGAQK